MDVRKKKFGQKLGDTNLISERQFSQSYSSFWRLITPTCDLFVRRLNLELYETFDAPIKSNTAPERRGFINEIAFGYFGIKLAELHQERTALSKEFETVISQTREKISQFERSSEHLAANPNVDELNDINEQVSMMLRFFRSQTNLRNLLLGPRFPGCGIIDTCAGDIFFDDVLFEIKAGERKFRSLDLRQLMTYAALNSTSHAYEFTSVGLFNPRQSISFEMKLDDLCYEVSGRRMVDVMADIVYALSSGEISH